MRRESLNENAFSLNKTPYAGVKKVGNMSEETYEWLKTQPSEVIEDVVIEVSGASDLLYSLKQGTNNEFVELLFMHSGFVGRLNLSMFENGSVSLEVANDVVDKKEKDTDESVVFDTTSELDWKLPEWAKSGLRHALEFESVTQLNSFVDILEAHQSFETTKIIRWLIELVEPLKDYNRDWMLAVCLRAYYNHSNRLGHAVTQKINKFINIFISGEYDKEITPWGITAITFRNHLDDTSETGINLDLFLNKGLNMLYNFIEEKSVSRCMRVNELKYGLAKLSKELRSKLNKA
jgi:hypothetical protein